MKEVKKYTIEEIVRELEKQDVRFYAIGNFDVSGDCIIHGLKHSFNDGRQYLRELRDLKGMRCDVHDFVRRGETFTVDSEMATPEEEELLKKAVNCSYYPWDIEKVFDDVSIASVCDYFKKSDEIRRERASYKRRRNSSKKINKLKVIMSDNYECRECGESAQLEVDHILPIIDGGTNDFSNLQTLCFYCHKRKTKHEALSRNHNKSKVVDCLEEELL